MDWKTGFKAERKAEWSEIAQAIHDTVTMEEVLAFYAPSIPRRGNRCPCPIHNGRDYNFSYTRYGYKCFVCGASGDVITFVKELRGLSTRVDAMKMLNDDLNLHLPISGNCRLEFREEISKRRAEAERLQAARDAWEQNYSRLMDEYVALDLIILFSTDFEAVAQAKERQGIVRYLLDTMPSKPK